MLKIRAIWNLIREAIENFFVAECPNCSEKSVVLDSIDPITNNTIYTCCNCGKEYI